MDQLLQTIDLVKSNPDIARFKLKANTKLISGGHSRTEIQGFYGAGAEGSSREKPFLLEGDEPPVLFGGNKSPNAVDVVLHALGSCLSVGFIYNAAAQGIIVKSLEFTTESSLDLHGFLGLSDITKPGYQNITVRYRVDADAPKEKLVELCKYVQRTSPVLDIIRNPVAVNVQME